MAAQGRPFKSTACKIQKSTCLGGTLTYFRSSWAAVDPTHIRQFSISSMNYFVRGRYENEHYRFSEESFESIECYLDGNYSRGPLRWTFTKLALRWPYRFENSVLSFLYPFETLTFVLKKK